jgi:hypothetical protein
VKDILRDNPEMSDEVEAKIRQKLADEKVAATE